LPTIIATPPASSSSTPCGLRTLGQRRKKPGLWGLAHLHVVPANAGTPCVSAIALIAAARSLASALEQIPFFNKLSQGLWIPAFAGTSRE
jgi:hypothetical protein